MVTMRFPIRAVRITVSAGTGDVKLTFTTGTTIMTVSLGNGVDIGNIVTAETNPVTGECIFCGRKSGFWRLCLP